MTVPVALYISTSYTPCIMGNAAVPVAGILISTNPDVKAEYQVKSPLPLTTSGSKSMSLFVSEYLCLPQPLVVYPLRFMAEPVESDTAILAENVAPCKIFKSTEVAIPFNIYTKAARDG